MVGSHLHMGWEKCSLGRSKCMVMSLVEWGFIAS